MRCTRAARGALVCVVLGGCTLLFPYPDIEAERGTLCTNASDDDGDGAIDCRDSSCDGACGESGTDTCSDGRDNDLDGRRDVEDAQCWAFAIADVERCESVGPSDFTGSFAPFSGNWTSLGASEVTSEPDPRDPARTVAHATPSDVPVLLVGPVLAGALDGIEMTFEMEVDDAVGDTTIGLMVEGADLRSGEFPDGLFVVHKPDSGGSPTVGVGGSGFGFPLPPPTAPGQHWTRGALRIRRVDPGEPVFEVDVDSRGFTETLDTFAMGFAGREPGRVPPALSDGRGLIPTWIVRGPTPARLGEVHVHVPRLDPCGHAVPQIPMVVRGLARGGGMLCALGADGFANAVYAWRSFDDGRTWQDRVEVIAGDVFAGDTFAGAAPLVHDGDRFVGVATFANGFGSVRFVHHVASEDCVTWETGDAGLLPVPGLTALGVGYSLLGPSTAPRHEITFIQYAPGSAAVRAYFLRGSSASGAAGSFALLDSDEETIPLHPLVDDAFAGFQILHVGEDLVVVYASDRGIDALVRTGPSTWAATEAPLLTRSAVVGTFDESLVTSPVLVPNPIDPDARAPALAGLLAFSGGVVCEAAECHLASAVARIELR